MRTGIAIAVKEFNTLLNTGEPYLPFSGNLKLPEWVQADTNAVMQSPVLQVHQQDIVIAEKSWELQKSKKLPDLFLGYGNQSFIGYQIVNGTDKYFNGSRRFNSVQAGVSVPVFTGAQNNRIKAAKIAVLQSQAQYDFRKQQLTTEYLNSFQQYKMQLASVQLYERTLLGNAETILKTVDLQFRNGAINYLEWAMLVN